MRRAVVFPGQGTRGGELFGEVRELVERVSGGEGVPYQLGVFATSVEILHRLWDAGVEPEVAAGHSLGEYAAAYSVGSLGLEDAARLVAERDRLMSEAAESRPGGMVALIGADPAEVEEAVAAVPEEEAVVVAANFNTPRQTVLSGEEAGLEAALSRLKGRQMRLEVAGAFHSPLMVEASLAMEYLLEGTEFAEPRMPMIGAADGSVLESAGEVREALRGQMLSPVRWVAVIERLEEMGIEQVVEAGEGGTLVRMLRDFKGSGLKGVLAKELLS